MSYSIYIEHMGSCPGRTLDAKRFELYFRLNDYKISRYPKKADIILFITCAYKKDIEAFALTRIRELGKNKGKLIVGGCLKGINEKILNEHFTGESFSTFENEHIDRLFPDFKVKLKDVPEANLLFPERIFQKLKRVSRSKYNIRISVSFLKRIVIYLREKTRFSAAFYIRICWGCVPPFCSYCVIWRAVGELRSKPIDICLKEFHDALQRGYRHIILIGDNVGAYGLDKGYTLPDLLDKFLQIKRKYTIQLEYINPMWLVKYKDRLISIFRAGKIKILNCPIQSGNSRILKLMNRKYDAVQLKETLLSLKSAYPRLKLYTHIIAGFPSETEKEFEDTLNLVKEVGCESVQLYPFCKNESLPKEHVQSEISEKVLNERLQKAVSFFHNNRIACLID